MEDSNKKIAKNTFLLYFRMGIIILINLYTARVVLDKLGVSDYGIYNVVAGFVALFSFVISALQTATQRFLNFYQDSNILSKVFSSAVINHFILMLLVVIIGETFGLWFVNNKLIIPEVTKYSANIVYQLSILLTALSIMLVPYNSAILAREDMNIYTYISIFEQILKLFAVILLSYTTYDKLVFYAVTLVIVQALINSIYVIFCRIKYVECRISFHNEKNIYIEQLKFSQWAFWGAMGFSFSNQGVNVLLNIFFGPAINAARGVAMQVNNLANSFLQNFQMAINPQIVKTYSSADYDKMFRIIFNGIIISVILSWYIICPLLFKIDFLLGIWLKEVPEYTSLFCQLILLKNLLYAFERIFNVANGATGENKKFSLMSAFFLNMTLPVSYLFILNGFNAYIVFVIDFIMFFFMTIWKAKYLKETINMNISKLFSIVIFPLLLMLLSTSIITLLVMDLFDNELINFIVVTITSFISISFFSFLFILNNELRLVVINKIKQQFNINYK